MKANFWRAVSVTALMLPGFALAQDVTLTAREGGLEIEGSLHGYDGEFLRINSAYGLLTVDAEGVLCDGPGCPDLNAPKTQIRIIGLAGLGEAILPDLMRSFAESRGLGYQPKPGPGYAAEIRDSVNDQVLAEISFTPASAAEAQAEVLAGRAELVLAARPQEGFKNKIVALEALVPIVSPENPLSNISTQDMVRILSGEVTNWSAVGGPDMPLVLHGLAQESAVQQVLTARLGAMPAAKDSHDDLSGLGKAVASDPWAIAMTLRSDIGTARALPLTDSCGFPLHPDTLSIKTQDYPLVLPLQFLVPTRHNALMLREFMTFLSMPAAQETIARAGFVDRQVMEQPLAAEGPRLIAALQHADSATSVKGFKHLAELMATGSRLSLTFRSDDTGKELDPASQENLAQLVQLLEVDHFASQKLVFAGFANGDAAADLTQAQTRAEAVLSALKQALPQELSAEAISFGGLLPIACPDTGQGRRLNNRVELWLMPKDSPPPGN